MNMVRKQAIIQNLINGYSRMVFQFIPTMKPQSISKSSAERR